MVMTFIRPGRCLGVLVVVALIAGCAERPVSAERSAPVGGSDSAEGPAPAISKGFMPKRIGSLAPPRSNAESVACNIETISSLLFEPEWPEISRGEDHEVLGWYSGPADANLHLFIYGDGGQHWDVPIVERQPRPDVASSIGDAVAAAPGFSVKLNLSELPPGRYGLYLANAAGDAVSACGVGRGIVIKE